MPILLQYLAKTPFTEIESTDQNHYANKPYYMYNAYS